MVEHKMLSWKTLDEFRCGRQMPWIDQDVVSQIKFLKHADAPQEFRLQEKAVVRLALDNVADTKKFRIRGEFRYLRTDIERAKINPSHNSENVWSRCN